MTQAITATGLRGFLQWLQADQPAIYAATAKQIAKAVPRGFSGFNGSVLQTRRLRAGNRSMRLRGFGDCCGVQSVGICAALTTPSICFDTSCAANTGTSSAVDLTGIANIINSVSGAALSASEASSYNSMVQSQLARAQQGLAPLTLTSGAAGIRTIASSLTSGTGGTILLIGGAAVLLWLLAK